MKKNNDNVHWLLPGASENSGDMTGICASKSSDRVPKNFYISIPAVIWFVGAGVLGFALCLLLTDGMSGALGWVTVSQACVILAVWPYFRRNMHHILSPIALIFLSAPVYAGGARLSGAGTGEVIMALTLLCMLFFYVSFVFRFEESRDISSGMWYMPLSSILVAGPIVVYYVLAEFLRYPMGWVLGISPVVALADGAYLRAGCAAWAGVLAVMVLADLSIMKEKK